MCNTKEMWFGAHLRVRSSPFNRLNLRIWMYEPQKSHNFVFRRDPNLPSDCVLLHVWYLIPFLQSDIHSKYKDIHFGSSLGLWITVPAIHSWSSGAKCNYKPQQKIDIRVQNMLWFDTICINQDFKSVIKDRNWGHWKLPGNNLFVMYLDWLLNHYFNMPLLHQTFAGKILNALILYLAQHLFKKIIYGIWFQSIYPSVFQLTTYGWCSWHSPHAEFELSEFEPHQKKDRK